MRTDRGVRFPESTDDPENPEDPKGRLMVKFISGSGPLHIWQLTSGHVPDFNAMSELSLREIVGALAA